MIELEPKIGSNRTGFMADRKLGKRMIEGTQEFPPEPELDDGEELARARAEYAEGSGPIGTMPPPATLPDKAKATAMKAAGKLPNLLLDKLGERVAFERTGVRLYEALISKLETSGSFDGGPTRDELARIRAEELQHFHLLGKIVDGLGGDPTAITPSADVHAVASMGVGAVMADPRSNLLACLEAILIAELVDQEGWQTLLELGRQLGDDTLTRAAELAMIQEMQHLVMVRSWVAAGQGRV